MHVSVSAADAKPRCSGTDIMAVPLQMRTWA